MKENYQPTFFMFIDIKTLNKTQDKQIQHIKKIISHDQVDLSQECQDGLTYANLCDTHYHNVGHKPFTLLTKCRKSMTKSNTL